RDAQNAIRVFRRCAFGSDRVRQRKRPRETAVRPLHSVIVVRIVLLLEMALAAERDGVVFDRQVKILALHPWQLSLEHNLIFVLIDIHTRAPRTSRNSFFIKGPRHVSGEQPIYFLLKTSQIAKRVVTNNAHNPEILLSLSLSSAWIRTSIESSSRVSPSA